MKDIVATRTIDAPVSRVWQTWVEPALVMRWWGAAGLTTPSARMDVREGGTSLVCMRTPDGHDLFSTWTYTSVEPMRRLEFVLNHADRDGNRVDPGTLGLPPDIPQDVRHTVTFEVLDKDRTELTVTEYGYTSDAIFEMSRTGLEYCLDRMVATLTDVAERYRRRADTFERTVAAVAPDQWANPSPCARWDARAVVGHIIEMHEAMLRAAGRRLGPAPALTDDPLGAYRAARADVQAVLDDPAVAQAECDTPMGRVTNAQHIDEALSEDLVLHGWDLARATGQDGTMDPDDVALAWSHVTAFPVELMEKFRTPDAFGPGIEVFGPQVPVPADAPLQDRLLGLIGRDPGWTSRG